MLRQYFASVMVASALVADCALADYLEVRRKASIKEQPASGAAAIKAVEPLDILRLVTRQQTNGYYHVRVPGSSETGWIYRSLGRGFPGDPPGETAAELAKIHVRVGKPQPYYEKFREGYGVGYDARLKIPLWVQYEISPSDFEQTVDRTDDFRPDITMPEHSRAANSDYDEKRSAASSDKYAKGHMAPAADMARSERVMSDSFYLSNMVPQVGPKFNGSVWQRLEGDIREWVKSHGAATIITGPVFQASQEGEERRVEYRVIGENEVAVPTHLYKIVLDHRNPDAPRALAFLMENRDYESEESYTDEHHLTSIDAIEQLTGLDFLSDLDDELEAAIEVRKTTQIWLSEDGGD